MPSETLLELTGVRTGYGSSPILQGIDLKVRVGEIVAVIGRNGVGKSTLMRCLIGQLRVWAV
jgi:urea transport system ATP-binding protein